MTATLDPGPIVIQAALEVRASDTPDTLATRLLDHEHVIYQRAVRWFVEDRLRVRGGVVQVEPPQSQLLFGADTGISAGASRDTGGSRTARKRLVA